MLAPGLLRRDLGDDSSIGLAPEAVVLEEASGAVAGNIEIGGAQRTRLLNQEGMLEERRRGHRVAGFEMVRLIANRLYFSRAYAILYICMVVLNIVMLIWLLMNTGEPLPVNFVHLEIAVTVLLGLEVSTRVLSQGKEYWKRWANWFEFCVLILCSVCLIATHQHKRLTMSEEVDELVSWALLILRYMLQGLRLLALVRHRDRIRKMGFGMSSYALARRRASSEIIDFGIMENENEFDLAFERDIGLPLGARLTTISSEHYLSDAVGGGPRENPAVELSSFSSPSERAPDFMTRSSGPIELS
mmetsp:Transcript_1587/g.2508  ORF Transcript_1587/g.2508 Transcript_1587/m.2508 type:complete len:302 (-) Transcript_1587:181-1086(-)